MKTSDMLRRRFLFAFDLLFTRLSRLKQKASSSLFRWFTGDEEEPFLPQPRKSLTYFSFSPTLQQQNKKELGLNFFPSEDFHLSATIRLQLALLSFVGVEASRKLPSSHTSTFAHSLFSIFSDSFTLAKKSHFLSLLKKKLRRWRECAWNDFRTRIRRKMRSRID